MAKARGKRPGNPKLLAAEKESADRYSANILPGIREIQASGIKPLRDGARALTARGVPTARGGAWTPGAGERDPPACEVIVSGSSKHLMV
jgi:hypothetical protein